MRNHYFLYKKIFCIHTNNGDNMEQNIEFLNYIYQNAQMGIIGIDNIKKEIKDKKMLKVIKEQEKDYQAICTEATKYLNKQDEDEKSIGMMAKMMTLIDAKMKTMTDKSVSNIAKMMIEGTNKGIIEIQEKLNNYEDIDKKTRNLAERLLEVEQKNIEELKKYL